MRVLNMAEINKLSVEKALEKIRACDAPKSKKKNEVAPVL